MNANMKKKLVWLIPAAIAAMAGFIALGGEIILQLWNWLLPPLFGLRQITFWQALGIIVFCRILFGGFGFHNSDRSGPRRRTADNISAQMECMTPEERERLRERLRQRWGLGATPREGEGQ